MAHQSHFKAVCKFNLLLILHAWQAFQAQLNHIFILKTIKEEVLLLQIYQLQHSIQEFQALAILTTLAL
jgi:hypothetical protein